jgi:hypothetical protein
VLFENKVVPVQPIAFETPLTVIAAELEASIKMNKIDKIVNETGIFIILSKNKNFNFMPLRKK